ncbi:MAG: hypothetical protein P8N09_11830 [Planctomycetota bacterium]|nr:hypothetical protein [Planctomycetota bacterium]
MLLRASSHQAAGKGDPDQDKPPRPDGTYSMPNETLLGEQFQTP